MSVFKQSKVYKPMRYQWAEDLRQEHENTHWITDEVSFDQDIVDFNNNLSDRERDFVKNILSIFTQSDLGVGNYYIDFLLPMIKNNEIRGMLSSFNGREWEHQRGYAQLNESLCLSESFYTEFLEHTATLDKYNFYTDNKSITDNFLLAIAKQVLTEGIALFGSFIMLKNFERYGLLMGTCKINEWSLRDETMHVEGNSMLFRTIKSERPELYTIEVENTIKEMCEEVVSLEHAFIDFVFKDYDIRGLKALDVKDYITFISLRRLTQLDIKVNRKMENPLPWFEDIANGSSLQNFFEGRSADYSINGLTGNYTYE